MIIPLKLRLQLQDVKRRVTRNPTMRNCFLGFFWVTLPLPNRFFQGKVFGGQRLPLPMIEFLTHFWSPNLGGHQSLLRLRSRRRMSAPANDAVQRANVWWRDSGASVKSGSKQNYTAPWFACLLGPLRRCFFFAEEIARGQTESLGMKFEKPEPNL